MCKGIANMIKFDETQMLRIEDDIAGYTISERQL